MITTTFQVSVSERIAERAGGKHSPKKETARLFSLVVGPEMLWKSGA
jgi:hypothetical protein